MLVTLALMTAVRLVLDPILIDRAVFLLFTLAVMLSAWYGGLIPGLLATALGAVIGSYFFMWPRIPDGFLPDDVLNLLLFTLTGIGIALLAESMHTARREAEVSESDAREAHESVKSTLDSISDSFLGFDSEFRFVYVNPAAERVMRRPAREVLGKSIWDLYPPARGTDIERACRKVMEERTAVTFETCYEPSQRWYVSSVYPERTGGISVYFQEITERKDAEREREQLITQLQEALAHVKLLSGILPICSACKKIRDSSGRWEQLELYIRDHSEAEFSHGMCPACTREYSRET